MGTNVRIVTASLLALTALATVAAPATQAATTTTCRVRNVTQDTAGRSFNAMAKDARDGDMLLVRGACEANGETLGIQADIVIRGVGDRRAVLTGRDRHRVLRVRPGAVVVLWHLAIERGRLEGHGRTWDNGGGILNRGNLTLVDSVVRRNTVEALGGGIFSLAPPCTASRCRDASLTLIDSVVTRNRARWGAGIHNNGSYEGGDARLTMQRSSVRDNAGNGIFNWGSAVLKDSVVAGNRGVGIDNEGSLILRHAVVRANAGGGIANDDDGEISYGTILLAASAVVSNSTGGRGGGILNEGGGVTLRRSTVTGNTAAGRGGGIWNGLRNAGYGSAPRGKLVIEDGSAVAANTSGDAGGGIFNDGGNVRIKGSAVHANRAGGPGGGIWNEDGYDEEWDEVVPGTITLDAAATVSGNTPDDCFGTTVC